VQEEYIVAMQVLIVAGMAVPKRRVLMKVGSVTMCRSICHAVGHSRRAPLPRARRGTR
jgi:hypothetical protein